MSTRENISSTNWLLTYVRRTLNHLLHKTRTFIVLSFNNVFRPQSTRSAGIVNDEPAGVLNALRYFSKTFALAFMIYLIASWFKQGEFEWRVLVETSIEISIATIITYVLCLALPDRIPLLRLIQAMLYVGGAFIVVNCAVYVPLSYLHLTLRVPTANSEVDVLATEYERCLSDNSMLHWLVRGDLKFLLYNDVWRPQDWANWFFYHYNYVLFIPFILIFALTLRPGRKLSFILICLFTAIAWATAVESSKFIKRQLTDLIVVRETKCTFGFLDQVTTKYAPDFVARQLTYKINNDLKSSSPILSSFVLHGTSFVMRFRLKSGVNQWQAVAHVPQIFRQSYCSDSELYWVAVRRINYNLLLDIYDSDDTWLHQQQFTPKDCPAWP